MRVIAASGCLLPLLIVINLLFGWIVFKPLQWLLSEGILILLFLLKAYSVARKVFSSFSKRDTVIDVEGEVVDEKEKTMRKRFIQMVSAVLLLLPSCLFAETIVFKSGKTVEGRIFSKTEKSIGVEASGTLLTYNLDEIKSIDGKRPDLCIPNVVGLESQKVDLQLQIVFAQGLDELNRQMYDNAIAAFSQAIQMKPDFFEAYYNRGLSLAQKGNLDQAIADYTKALDINSHDADTYYNRGVAYHKKSDSRQAIADYSQAIQINPNVPSAYYNRALDYYLRQEFDKAWDDVHKAESLGYKVSDGFLAKLKEASKRQN